MKTTTPPLLCQSHQTWREHIQKELDATREHIAACELVDAIWEATNPRRERCEHSWS